VPSITRSRLRKPDALECSHQNPVLILNSKGLVI
jgi:hypothetical protein